MKKSPVEFEKLQEEYFKVTKEKKCSENFCKYVWNTLVCTSRGYGFNLAHTLSYSIIALQEMNLAYKYPSIFWDTACLIVDSGAMNLSEEIEEKEDDEEKLENSTMNYGKVASAIGKIKARGISFSLPDINKSAITFTPDLKTNTILYGIRGITRIGNQLVKDILSNRPYADMEDFLSKVKVNKTQMINLIKAGTFDNLYGDRKKAMKHYLVSIADCKKRVTLQNMQMLINQDLVPPEYQKEVRIFNYNKYIRKNKVGDNFELDERALNFFISNYGEEKLEEIRIEENKTGLIKKEVWEKIYKKEMNPIRDWIKVNSQDILDKLNMKLLIETKEKYAKGTISKWEMESLSFYYHEHELALLQNEDYGIIDYMSLPDEPIIKNQFETKNGEQIKVYEINRIAGTVIDKNKNKGLVTLLTTTGVVTVKVWKNQFNIWDKQISRKNPDGTKTVVEKSWFTRGNKLIVTGIKKENCFMPKKYKNTVYPLFEKIEEIDKNGYIVKSITERPEEE